MNRPLACAWCIQPLFHSHNTYGIADLWCEEVFGLFVTNIRGPNVFRWNILYKATRQIKYCINSCVLKKCTECFLSICGSGTIVLTYEQSYWYRLKPQTFYLHRSAIRTWVLPPSRSGNHPQHQCPRPPRPNSQPRPPTNHPAVKTSS